MLAKHPWAIGIKARTSPGPATLGHLDSVIGCLTAAGFSMPMTGHALSILDSDAGGEPEPPPSSRGCGHASTVPRGTIHSDRKRGSTAATRSKSLS